MLATESDLDSIARSVARSAPRGAGNVTMPFIAVKNLKGFRFWADERKRTGFEANPKTFVVNGEGWSYIKKFERSQDGRKAYLALKTQCEGTASKITRKNKAYASIANASYSGSRRQYKFQDFINVHQTAHNEILDCDPTEAVPNPRKLLIFSRDYRSEIGICRLSGAWRSQAAEQFQACQQYLSTTVENRATLERSKERNISGVKSGEKTDKTAKAGKLPKGFKLENKYYPPKIFRLLSQEQKDQLKEWGDKKGKRSVAALKKQIKEVEERDEETGKGNDNDGDDDHESSADEAAGKEFGRGAQKKQKLDKA
ncbi:hypothetical protein MHU86_25463 [Fragilaria crotonensis]|nr:hypothetical protein MHU86_25463 [Fragilaria crotonensis]